MINIKVDISDFLSLSKMEEVLKSELDKIGMQVAQEAYAHAIEEADKKLHTTKDIFVENLSVGKEDDVYVLVLDASAVWTDDGQEPHSMIDSLLNSPKAKMGKNGKYLVVPFQANKEGKTGAKANLIETIKSSMKDRNIGFNDIETNPDGSAKTGLLHKFDINENPLNAAPNKIRGHGGFGSPLQGKDGIPFLHGVRVYQKKVKNQSGGESIKRFVGTFRTVSESQRNSTKWHHPGSEGGHIFEETEEYIKRKFSEDYLSKILDSVVAKLK